jgi:hypothetical protein
MALTTKVQLYSIDIVIKYGLPGLKVLFNREHTLVMHQCAMIFWKVVKKLFLLN